MLLAFQCLVKHLRVNWRKITVSLSRLQAKPFKFTANFKLYRCWKKPRRWRSTECFWKRCCNRTDGRWCHCLFCQLNQSQNMFFESRVKLLYSFKTTVVFLKLSTVVSFRPVHCAVPVLWNSLPLSKRTSRSLAIFKKHLKTFLFRKAYNLLE